MAADSVTFGQRLLESIWDNAADDLQENAYDSHRCLGLLMNKRKDFKKTDLAGRFFGVPVNVLAMNISQQVAEGAEYNLINVETMQEAQYRACNTLTPLIFTDEELSENQGKAKVIDTAKSKLRLAGIDHYQAIDFQFVRGSGTYPSTESLNTLIGTADNGGLSVATYPNWKAHVDNTSQALAATVIDGAIDATQFSSAQGVDFLFSGQTLFTNYKKLAAASTTIFQPADRQKANAAYTGVEVITFRDAMWFWDRNIPDQASGLGDTQNYLYGIDSQNIRWLVQKGVDAQVQKDKVSLVALSKHIPIVTRYNFAPFSRRAHFLLSNITKG